MIYESLNNWTVAMVLDKIRKDEQKQVADKYSTRLITAYSKQHKIKQYSEQYCLMVDWALACMYNSVPHIK